MKTEYVIRMCMLFGGIAVLFVLYFLIKLEAKNREEKRNTSIMIKTKKKKSRKLYSAYKFFVEFPVTRKFIQKLQKIYEIRIPGDIRQSREKAMKQALVIWVLWGLTILFLVFTQPSLLGWLTVIYTAYVIGDQIVRINVERFDRTLIEQLSTFIDDVRHRYFVHGMPDESIASSLEKAPYLMKLHGQRLLDILESEEMVDELEKYCETVPNYFLKMFADTCVKIMQYGDKEVDGQSLFQISIHNIKEEIQTEQLKQTQLKAKFAALTGISVVPVYAIYPLKKLGISGFSGMKDLMDGSYGMIATVVCFLVSLCLYRAVIVMKNSVHVDLSNRKMWEELYQISFVKKLTNGYLTKNWGRTLRLRSLLKNTGSPYTDRSFMVMRFSVVVLTFFLGIVAVTGLHWQNRRLYGGSVNAAMTATSGASDDECFQMLMIARQLLLDYKDVDIRREYNSASGQRTMYFDDDVSKYLQSVFISKMASEDLELDEELMYSLVDVFLKEHDSMSSSITNLEGLSYEEASSSADPMVQSGFNEFQELVKKAARHDNTLTDSEREGIAKTTAERIRKYQNEYFHWYDLMLIALLAFGMYHYPVIMLKIQKKAFQMDMDDEVIQFKSSIMLLMHIERMSAETILESMLMISNIFQKSIQRCINNMPLDEEAAYDQLQEEEPFEPFRRLVENLRMVDKVGVEQAFSTVPSERKSYQEIRKTENEISISNRGAVAATAAMIPTGAVIFGFMVIPYVICAVQEFSHALADMSTYLG